MEIYFSCRIIVEIGTKVFWGVILWVTLKENERSRLGSVCWVKQGGVLCTSTLHSLVCFDFIRSSTFEKRGRKFFVFWIENNIWSFELEFSRNSRESCKFWKTFESSRRKLLRISKEKLLRILRKFSRKFKRILK